MKAYKLTDQNGQTFNKTQWSEGTTHEANGTCNLLCSDGFIHFYTHPLIAVLLNPVHANFKNPILWECECEGEILREPLKAGCKKLTTIKKLPLPEITLTQRVAFAILCAKKVYKEEKWNKWADKWLSGEDISFESAYNAYSDDVTVTDIDATTKAAHYVANYAVYAADCSTRAAADAAEWTAEITNDIYTLTEEWAAETANAIYTLTEEEFIEIAKEAVSKY